MGDGVRMPRFQYERVISESRRLISGQPFADGPDSALWADAKTKVYGDANPALDATVMRTCGLRPAAAERPRGWFRHRFHAASVLERTILFHYDGAERSVPRT